LTVAIFLLGAYATFVMFLIASPVAALRFLAVLLGIPLGLVFAIWAVLYVTQPFA
jgi:hypothetical protein